jgi:hypothetical protein
MVKTPGIASGGKAMGFSEGHGSQLRGGSFAEDNKAGLPQSGDNAVVVGGEVVFEGRVTAGEGDSLDGIEVFDGDRNAKEGGKISRIRLHELLGFSDRFLLGHVGHDGKVAAQGGIEALNPIEVGLDEILGGEMAIANLLGLL